MKDFHGDFALISDVADKDINGRALYLRHKKCGLEVVHLVCDDSENLFAFAFRTPVMNSKGAPHIMEHSVLCGSEKYPLKEPFVNLMTQSVNTFLNAMTYPDMTMYPASSVSVKDYYNLMSVYGDAVFFPKLTREAFAQEAHRLEVDNNGKFSIQGVVYNEMKGEYSSFAQVASNVQVSTLMDGTCYKYDSGGDPVNIVDFTYDDFVHFHQKYYKMSNCLLFLYGNIKTEEQLDFVQHEFIDRWIAVHQAVPLQNVTEVPYVDAQMRQAMTSHALTSPIEVRASAPDSDSGGAQVTVQWRTTAAGKSYSGLDTIEASFLMNLLAGNEASPISRALNDSGLGDRLMCSLGSSTSNIMMYLGLTGVKAGNEEKVKCLIMDTLRNTAKKGFTRDEIAAAVLAMDFSVREKTRSSGGPFSLVLMEITVSAWIYGGNPALMTERFGTWLEMKKRMTESADESAFCVSLLRRLLLDNEDRAFIVVTPSREYIKEREEKEASIIKDMAHRSDVNAVRQKQNALHKMQGRKESEEETACIPRLAISDLSPNVPQIKSEITTTRNGVPLILNRPESNGIVYFEVMCPVDMLPIEDLPYLNILGECAFNMGWDGKPWHECETQLAVCSSGIVVSPVTDTARDGERARIYSEAMKRYNFVGRDWLRIGCKFPIEKAEEVLSLYFHAMQTLNFDDTDRLNTIVAQEYDTFRSAVIPLGHRMAASRARCRLSREGALSEVWDGLSQVFTIKRLSSMMPEEVGERLAKIMRRILNAGSIVHITADNESMDKVLKVLDTSTLTPPLPRPNVDNDALYKLTLLPGEELCDKNVSYMLKTQVGFAAAAWMTGKIDANREAAADALCHWMGSNVLWETIRTKGGAYGASAAVNSNSAVETMCTYRDPNAQRSVIAFRECMEKAAQTHFSASDVERLVTGCYSDYVEPMSPAGYGGMAIRRILYAVTEDDRSAALQALLALSADMLHNEAVRQLETMDNLVSAVICDKAIGTGTVIDLNL